MPVSMTAIVWPLPLIPKSCHTAGAPMNGTLWRLSAVYVRTGWIDFTPGSLARALSLRLGMRSLMPL